MAHGPAASTATPRPILSAASFPSPARRRAPARPSRPRAIALALLPLLLLLPAGCATVTRSECQAGDWRAIGERDGRDGKPETLVDQHAEGCARFGLDVDRDAWQAGRAAGLVAYCTAPSGWAAGVAGNPYHGVCSGPAGGEFLTAYGFGSDVNRARADAGRAESEVDRLERRLDAVEDDIGDVRARLAVAEGPDRERLRDWLRDLEGRRFDLRADLFEAERDRRTALRAAEAAESLARAAYFRAFGRSPG